MNKEDYAKALGKNIQKRRLALEMSQEDLGNALGVSDTQISRVELGKTNVTVASLRKIAEALNTKPAKLLP